MNRTRNKFPLSCCCSVSVRFPVHDIHKAHGLKTPPCAPRFAVPWSGASDPLKNPDLMIIVDKMLKFKQV